MRGEVENGNGRFLLNGEGDEKVGLEIVVVVVIGVVVGIDNFGKGAFFAG